MTRQSIATLVFTTIVATLTSGCGSHVESTPVVPSTTSASESSTVEGTSPIKVPSSSSLNDFFSLTNGVIAWGCVPGSEGKIDSKNGAIMTIDPIGERQRLPTPVIPAHSTLINQSCSISGHGEDARLIYGLQIRTDPDGLNPESYDLILETFSLNTTSPEHTTTVDRSTKQFDEFGIFSIPDGIVINDQKTSDTADTQHNAQAFRTPDLSPIWSSPNHGVIGSAGTTVMLTEHVEWTGADEGGRLILVSGKDGKEVASFPWTVGEASYTVTHLSNDGYTVKYPKGSYITEGAMWVDGTTGHATPIDGAGDLILDPLSDLMIAVNPADSSWGMKIVDRQDGSTKYTVDGSTLKGLNLNGVTISNKNLYLATSSGSSVVDAQTGATVQHQYAHIPYAVVGQTAVVCGTSADNYPNDIAFRSGHSNIETAEDTIATLDTFTTCKDLWLYPNPEPTYSGPTS